MFKEDSLRRASVSLLGIALLGLALANVFPSEADLWLRLVESGLPIGLSLIFLAFGVVLWERREDPEAMVINTGWAVSGSVVTGALAIWLLAVITFQNAAVRDATFVVSSSATVGATFGRAAGFYVADDGPGTHRTNRSMCSNTGTRLHPAAPGSVSSSSGGSPTPTGGR